MYPIDLTPAGQRGATLFADNEIETFRLFKLHGSINWFYSGRSQFYGENLYFVPCKGGVNGAFDALSGCDLEGPHWKHVEDKIALIIPPILDKTIFFQHESLRSMWIQAAQAIRDAEEVVCMGYSLPAGDLTMAQFLKTAAPDKKIRFNVLDVSPKSEHFRAVIGKDVYDFQQTDTSEKCIPRFVVNHCISSQKDRDYVFRMTDWHEPEAK